MIYFLFLHLKYPGSHRIHAPCYRTASASLCSMSSHQSVSNFFSTFFLSLSLSLFPIHEPYIFYPLICLLGTKITWSHIPRFIEIFRSSPNKKSLSNFGDMIKYWYIVTCRFDGALTQTRNNMVEDLCSTETPRSDFLFSPKIHLTPEMINKALALAVELQYRGFL